MGLWYWYCKLGLVVRPWSTERRGDSPPFLYTEKTGDDYVSERILSVFGESVVMPPKRAFTRRKNRLTNPTKHGTLYK